MTPAQLHWLRVLAGGGTSGREVPIATARALQRRGLVEIEGRWASGRNGVQDGWGVTITEAGRAALAAKEQPK